MNKKKRILIWSVLTFSLVWIALTIYVELPGKPEMFTYGNAASDNTALIVYDPDPFYNLDEQLCKSVAKGLARETWQVRVATVKAADEIMTDQIDLFVFCANTYNWAPDWGIKGYIANRIHLKDKNVVAITLGSGSTNRASRLLEELIIGQGAHLLKSKQYWLMRPNNESIKGKSNVEIANEQAFQLGTTIAAIIRDE